MESDRTPESTPPRVNENPPESPNFVQRPGSWPPRPTLDPLIPNPGANPRGSLDPGPNMKGTPPRNRRTVIPTNGPGENSRGGGSGTAETSTIVDPLHSKRSPLSPNTLPRVPENEPVRIVGQQPPKDFIIITPNNGNNANRNNNNRQPRDREQRLRMAEPVLPPPPPPVPLERRSPAHDTNGGNSGSIGNSGPVKGDVESLSQSHNGDDGFLPRQPPLKYELRDSPGIVPLILYGLQHYLSIVGSIILIPLVIVPAMGGSDKDTARVVSSVLMVTGLTTLLHTFFGSRLPLIQGASFVYLAPTLAIIHSQELLSIVDGRFKETMQELQGAILVASAFQFFMGYSGLMSLFVRLINPVVVAPTVAAVGLAFFSYGFPLVGTCVEIGIPQILLITCFALYLRKISIHGHRIFQVYAVPLGLGIAWAYALLLTETGHYNFEGCDMDTPISNESCRSHVFTMKHCRTDTSNALKKVPWLIAPHPFQWGYPKLHWKNAGVMIAASIIATVDSVGTYHASSLLVASRTPTPGVVSRGIGMEGLSSALAGIWGIGTGANTLTENVHTIAVTRMGSRRVIEFGACVLIALSFVGKVGAFIASIPIVLAAALLCVMWTMLTALGLSNLRYSETGSCRNVLILGLSLFFSLSVPSYFQNYRVTSVVPTVPSYFQSFTAAANGPIQTGIETLDYILNTVLSMHMAISFIVAFVLDNTVPGSPQERGTYIWSKAATAKNQPEVVKDYRLPKWIASIFTWVRWVGF